MYKAFELFEKNINEVRDLTSLYEYLLTSITSPFSFEDLLRAQIVYSVSAFDKLIHDIIRIGMIEIFTGKRLPTPKYLAESISIETYNQMISATIPPKEYIFEQAIFQKFKTVSFQTPEKIAEIMETDDKTAKTTLKLIVNRRNTIVHEADIDPLTNEKYPISIEDCQKITDFIYGCGKEIVELVILKD